METTTTTVLARNGTTLGRDYQIDGWYGYINDGEYTDDQQGILVEALMAAQEIAFDRLLPRSCFWTPSTGEITGPVGTSLEGFDLEELMEKATNSVASDFEDIENDALGIAITLYNDTRDGLAISHAGTGEVWNLGGPSGDYLHGTFAANAHEWADQIWWPTEVDGHTQTTREGLTPVAECRNGVVRTLVADDQIGPAARTYLGMK